MKLHTEAPKLYPSSPILDSCPVFLNSCNVSQDEGPFHYHNFIELCYVAGGQGFHQIRDQVHCCKKGDIYILGTGVPHCFMRGDPQSQPLVINNLLFIPEFIYKDSSRDIINLYNRLTSSVTARGTEAIYLHLSPSQFRQTNALYRDIRQEFQTQEQGFLTVINAQLTLFLIRLIRLMDQQGPQRLEYKNPAESTVESAVRYIQQNYHNPHLTLDVVAKNVYVGKPSLSRLFQEITGEYFSDYLRNIRLEESCRLLRQSRLSNQQIMEICGFSDLPYFYIAFKKHMGMTPGQYRKQNHEEG